MEMHQIRYFLALCDELNFTRAAENVQCRAACFDPSHKAARRGVRRTAFSSRACPHALTELGAAVRPYLLEVQQQSHRAKKLASSLIDLQGTRLKLGIMCTIGPGNFVGLLNTLQAQYPGIELEIFDAGAPELQERLLEGALEAAIYCWPDQVDERLHYIPLFREQFFIVLGRQHRLAMRNAVRVSELNGERYLNRINCEQVNLARDVFAKHGTKVERIYRSERDDRSWRWRQLDWALPSCRSFPSRSSVTLWCARWSSPNSGGSISSPYADAPTRPR